MINAASTTTSQDAINQASTHFLMKANYDNSSTTVKNFSLVHANSQSSKDIELLPPQITIPENSSKDEETNHQNYGEASTPLQHMMIKQYLFDVTTANHDRANSVDAPVVTQNSKTSINLKSAKSSKFPYQNPQNEHTRNQSIGFSQTLQSQQQIAHGMIPRLATATSFMPANRHPNQMKKMKLSKKQGSNLQNAYLKSPKKDQDSIVSGKQRMQRYAQAAQERGTNGYSKMVHLNGGSAIGEENMQQIEKCMGLSSQMNSSKKVNNRQSPKMNAKQEDSKLKKLEDEQREIEAKLKFIDGLINQQSSSGVNGGGAGGTAKFYGGGILKPHRTDEFVISLEQYQRAINDLKNTMDVLNANVTPGIIYSSVPEDEQMNQEKDQYLKSKQLITKSGFFSDISKNEHQTNQGQIDEALARQQQAKQVFSSVIPQVLQSMNLKPQLKYLDDGIKSVMSSRPSSTNMEANFQNRKSMEQIDNRNSLKSSTLTGFPTKLEHIGLYQDKLTSNMTSSRDDSPDPNFPMPLRSPQHQNKSLALITDEGLSSADRRTSQCKLRVVTEVIINNGGRNFEDDHSPQNERDKLITNMGSENIGCLRETFNMAKAMTKTMQNTNYQSIEMNKVDMVYEGKTPLGGGGPSVQSLNEDQLQTQSVYEKQYKTHTELTHPSFVQQNIQARLKAQSQNKATPLNGVDQNRWHSQSSKNIIQLKLNPLANGLTLKPKDQSDIIQTSCPKLNQHQSDKIQVANFAQTSTVQVKNDYQDSFDPKRLADLGRKTQSSAIHGQDRTKFEIIDKNVIYQQDGDMSKGVLYFKNLDSLKSFLSNKKRPIFSKQGDRILQNTATTFKSFQIQGKKNGGCSASVNEDEKERHLSADINKKRQFLHTTLSTLMPQLQSKALKHAEQKMNFQQTVDFVSKKYLCTPTTQNVQGSTAPATSTQWAPISSLQQTLYNPIPKTQYLFDDIMNADGIIDLRFMGSTSPSTTFYNNRLFNQAVGPINQGVQAYNANRSETSPGNSRNAKPLPKRLQTFYGFQYSQIEQNIKKAKAMQDPRNNNSAHKSRNTLNNNISEATLSDSQGTNSSHNVTRQVVFFKTNTQNKFENVGGSYNLQYPQLRPRLNMEDGKSQLRLSSHTVGLHQQYHNSKGAGQLDQTTPKNVVPGSAGQLTKPNQNGKQKFESILRLSKDPSVEGAKFRESATVDSKLAVRSFSAMEETLSQSVLAIAETIGSMKENNALKASIQQQQQQRARKHVIFSNYEGKESMHPRATKMMKNTQDKKTPPLYPQAQAKTSIQSHTNLRSEESHQSSYPTENCPLSPQHLNEGQILNKKPSLRGILSPMLTSGIQGSPSRYDEQRGSLYSGGGSRGQSRESQKQNAKTIKQVALKTTLAQNKTNHDKMDLNIASNKFTNQQSLVC